MTFDELFDAFFPVEWVDEDPPKPKYLAATMMTGQEMYRDLFGQGPGSWDEVIPSWAEIATHVVLAPIRYTMQGSGVGPHSARLGVDRNDGRYYG